MSDFLTRRHGAWHFVRRVPSEFASLDPRGIIRRSTKVRIAGDRNGRIAAQIAERLNSELEAFWHGRKEGKAAEELELTQEARRTVRELGFE